MPIALLTAAAFAASIVTCCAPEEKCAGLAISAVDAGRHEMLVNAYALAIGSGIPAALIRAYGRGVDVPSARRERHSVATQPAIASPSAAGGRVRRRSCCP